jgi:hypothetical protein
MGDGVLQSGNITPGHVAVWETNGVIGDGGPLLSSKQVLAYLLSADFNSIADQPLLLPSTITAFAITGIIVTNTAVSLTTAVGGFYPQAAKGGTAIVANSQVYSSLNASSKLLNCTVPATPLATYYTRANVPDWAIYLSLTTAQGSNATADCYLLGIDLSA